MSTAVEPTNTAENLAVALALSLRANWLFRHPRPLFSDSTDGERHAAQSQIHQAERLQDMAERVARNGWATEKVALESRFGDGEGWPRSWSEAQRYYRMETMDGDPLQEGYQATFPGYDDESLATIASHNMGDWAEFRYAVATLETPVRW